MGYFLCVVPVLDIHTYSRKILVTQSEMFERKRLKLAHSVERIPENDPNSWLVGSMYRGKGTTRVVRLKSSFITS